jgi:hypothetical protein
MSARNWYVYGFAIAVVALLARVTSASDGRPSRDSLAEMGLSGLVVLTDGDAMAIRGQGFKPSSSARAWGNSFATINTKGGSASSENGYAANGKHYASGNNLSFAGAIFTTSGGKGDWGKPGRNGMGGKPGGHTTVKSVIVFAGGFSSAKAH